jgi:hypothetical protein
MVRMVQTITMALFVVVIFTMIIDVANLTTLLITSRIVSNFYSQVIVTHWIQLFFFVSLFVLMIAGFSVDQSVLV